jgi:hypothetical protein
MSAGKAPTVTFTRELTGKLYSGHDSFDWLLAIITTIITAEVSILASVVLDGIRILSRLLKTLPDEAAVEPAAALGASAVRCCMSIALLQASAMRGADWRFTHKTDNSRRSLATCSSNSQSGSSNSSNNGGDTRSNKASSSSRRRAAVHAPPNRPCCITPASHPRSHAACLVCVVCCVVVPPQPAFPRGDYLWELIGPKDANGQPARSTFGKYRVKLWLLVRRTSRPNHCPP